MAISVAELSTAQHWTVLETVLSVGQGNSDITTNIVRHLKELNARSLLLDDDYIDRDFSEAFSAYYAKTFKRHSKVCKRLLFFSCDLSSLSTMGVETAAKYLDGLNEHFLGFIVLRPITKAPISQAILRPPPSPTGFERHLLVRARYTAHVLGAELSVDAVPMTQQDSRVGACAQASIWVSVRHIHARHRGPWLSTVSITDAAIVRSESQINATLPAGSEFLTVNNTVSAFRAAGREPLIYAANIDPQTGVLQWGALRPKEIINRYVDSGIPVSVWLTSPGSSISHSVVAAGQVLSPKAPASLPTRPTRAEYCAAFLINDDQRGANLRLPSSPNPVGEVPFNVQDDTVVLIIPLPSKVYLPAETAETIAWAILDQYANDWSSYKTANAGNLGKSETLGDTVVAAHANNTIVARTYLTYGWKYKHRAIRNNLGADTKKIVRDLDVPRYVYVTEFSLASQLDDRSLTERRIVADVVVDATAKHHDLESVLFFHAPGLCLWHSHGSRNDLVRYVVLIADDEEYFPKVRGNVDFASFNTP